MINPHKELFKWGPIDGLPIYIDAFSYTFEVYPKFVDGTWPDLIGYYKDGRITFIGNYQSLRDEGKKLFEKYVRDDVILKNKYQEWLKSVEKLMRYEQFAEHLEKLNDRELSKVYINFLNDYTKFWVQGFLPELSNYGIEKMLTEMIKKHNNDNFAEILEVLSAPEDISFFQTEEKELLGIKFIQSPQEKSAALTEHQKKYYWLRNNYAETRVLNEDYFRQELEKISNNEAEEKIAKIANYPKNVQKRKKTLIEKYQIPDDIAKIAKKLAYCVWWQDLRKKYIFIANHIITQFLRQAAKRRTISFGDLLYYREWEIADLLQNNKKVDIAPRKIGYIVYYHHRGKITELEGKDANNYIEPYLNQKIGENVTEFIGLVVSHGKQAITESRVKILLTPKNLQKMNKGDILVAPYTSPDYIVAMRQASAVITDEGGMTSHAAIVSRELGIPCVVGTKIATKVLKDGDRVEIDANKGIIKLLK